MKTLKRWRKLRLYRKLMKMLLGNEKQIDYHPITFSNWAKKFVDLYFTDVWK